MTDNIDTTGVAHLIEYNADQLDALAAENAAMRTERDDLRARLDDAATAIGKALEANAIADNWAWIFVDTIAAMNGQTEGRALAMKGQNNG